MTELEADRLATAVHALRPDWPRTSVRTVIGHDLLERPYAEAAAALLLVALDPETKTPRRVLLPGHWWMTPYAAVGPPRPRYTAADLCSICGHPEPDCQARAKHPADGHRFAPSTRRAGRAATSDRAPILTGDDV